MIYVVSDIHGCYDQFNELLGKIKLGGEDRLYILGDILDRGPDGIRLILEVMQNKNIRFLRGNHDHEALFHFKNVMKTKKPTTRSESDRLCRYLSDGGKVTYDAFLQLDDERKSSVIRFLDASPWFEDIEVNGKRFFLSHTVPEKRKFLQPEKCKLYDFIMGEPEYEKEYRKELTIVTGHTPTSFIAPDHRGSIWAQNGHLAIDCGTVYGGRLGCVCLDTMEEFYS